MMQARPGVDALPSMRQTAAKVARIKNGGIEAILSSSARLLACLRRTFSSCGRFCCLPMSHFGQDLRGFSQKLLEKHPPSLHMLAFRQAPAGVSLPQAMFPLSKVFHAP